MRLLRPALLAIGLCLPTTAMADAPDPAAPGLRAPDNAEIAMQLVASAENSTLNWRGQFGYIEDIGDNRGYTAGLIGFTTGTGDLRALVERYTASHPHNGLARFLPALRAVDGSASHRGLDPDFPAAWAAESALPAFQSAQIALVTEWYLSPAVDLAKADGLNTLGQFIYFDAAVVHGFPDIDRIRARAIARTRPPAQGGAEIAYLNAFLDARVIEMRSEAAHDDVSRIETAQRRFLAGGNLGLDLPLTWQVYGDSYAID